MWKKHSSKKITFRFVKIRHQAEVADQAVVADQAEAVSVLNLN